tara:strand:- start:1030 stop:1659 length:630 start_codon:yes stop_codon:yes gene_type:complete
MIIGNIVTDIEISEKNFNIVKCLEDCKDSLPTLIIGWNLTKTTIEEVSIIHKQINEKLWWTFNPTERKVDFEGDIERFKDLCYSSIGKHLHYVYIDPLHSKKKIIKKILNKIYSFNECFLYITPTNMLYIYSENLIFGVDLNVLDFIGIKKDKILDKIEKLSNCFLVRNEIFNICKEFKEKINNREKMIPYIYSNGKQCEDNDISVICE